MVYEGSGKCPKNNDHIPQKEQFNIPRRGGISGRRRPKGFALLKEDLIRNQGCDRETAEFLLESWSTGTKKVYETYMSQWATFCIIHRVSLRSPSPFEVCRFLRILSDRGRAFGTVNAARCALSVLVKNLDNGKTMGTHYWVCRAVRTAYRRNPPSPRYNKFWDIRLVFSMFQRWGANEDLSLQFLGFKLLVLILLLTGQRGQVIPALDLRNMICLVWGLCVLC